MEKYQLPGWIKISRSATNGKFLLTDTRRGREFFINETIRNFLLLLKEPLSIRDIIRQGIDHSLSFNKEKLTEAIKVFIDEIRSMGVLVAQKELNELELHYNRPLLKRGEKVNGYIIKKTIAVSTKAQVYLATDANTGKNAVIKLFFKPLHLVTPADMEKLLQFRQEFRLMKRFRNHKNICTFYEYCEDEYAYGVVEYIEGKNLRDVFKSRQCVIEDKHTIASGIISSIAALHSANIIHGDIHASNFIVDDDHGVKLIDFGFGFINDSEKKQIKSNGGVSYYIPPERVKAHGYKLSRNPPDFRSEVYQAGLILYCLYTSSMPFRGRTWRELGKSIIETPIVFPGRTINNEPIPGPVKEFIGIAMAKNSGDRFADACVMRESWLTIHESAEDKTKRNSVLSRTYAG